MRGRNEGETEEREKCACVSHLRAHALAVDVLQQNRGTLREGVY